MLGLCHLLPSRGNGQASVGRRQLVGNRLCLRFLCAAGLGLCRLALRIAGQAAPGRAQTASLLLMQTVIPVVLLELELELVLVLALVLALALVLVLVVLVLVAITWPPR